jgi:arsenate reductase-like glutaredoxin family protein
MEWILFTSQLPATTSSLRVTVWRRMKAAGAVNLQNGVWLLPRAGEAERSVQELLKYLEEQGAEGQSFFANAISEKIEADILKRFRALRDEEYTELIERCGDLLSELAKETDKNKFTFAELEENEDDIQKLENWFHRIKARDLTGGEHAEAAARSLETCREALHHFANQVYAHEHISQHEDESK